MPITDSRSFPVRRPFSLAGRLSHTSTPKAHILLINLLRSVIIHQCTVTERHRGPNEHNAEQATQEMKQALRAEGVVLLEGWGGTGVPVAWFLGGFYEPANPEEHSIKAEPQMEIYGRPGSIHQTEYLMEERDAQTFLCV